MRRAVVATIASLALVLAGFALVPAGAAALDSDLKHSYAFRVEASNGYSIAAVASSERADGRGEIVLFVVHGRDSGAYYVAPATLTATRIDADLGPLGRVALDVAPSGRKEKLRSTCGEEPEVVDYEPWVFSGSFEFHGEEGFAEAVSASPRDYSSFFARFVCASGFGESVGSDLPGARLSVLAAAGAKRVSLRVVKNRPRARTRLEATLREKRGEITVVRFLTTHAGGGAFDYDPLLRTATLDPPAPFSGYGSFHRNASPASRWRGNLAVDFPGRSDVPLTGGNLRAILVHARFGRE